jgi:hypothetical protein
MKTTMTIIQETKCYFMPLENKVRSKCWWLATQEAENRRIKVQSQPGQIVYETYLENTHHKKRAGGVAQGIGPNFKLQYHKKTKNKG